jgi:putative ATP-binding cassette transporter
VRILDLLGRELRAGGWRRFLFLAIVSGGSSAAVLAIINGAASNTHDADSLADALIALVIALVVYLYSQVSLMMNAASLAERTAYGMRDRLLGKLRAAELIEVEALDRSEIFACISTEIRAISDGASGLMIVAQSFVLAVVTLGYLAIMSLPAFVLAIVFIGIGATAHVARNQQIIVRHEQMFHMQAELSNSFGDFVDGFKEVKLNDARSQELAEKIDAQSVALSNRQLDLQNLFSTSFAASQVTFFLLTAIMVFVVPAVTEIEASTVSKITATTLFLIGPISAVVVGLPTLQRLNAAADAVLRLEQKLQQIGKRSAGGATILTDFARIELDDAVFRYPTTDDEAGFCVGPVRMTIERSKIVFITGGNGSGKSTLLKMITGLYLPTEGELCLDGAMVESSTVGSYRSLFSAIFAENHLFREFYGIPDAKLSRASELVALVELQHKVAVNGRSFSTVTLSSGQRKRLALVMALMEDRPIYVFDEWAADQDPYFRQKFYHEILPQLKAGGKTVIAVSHDERYYGVADVRYHLEEGRLARIADQAMGTADGSVSATPPP